MGSLPLLIRPAGGFIFASTDTIFSASDGFFRFSLVTCVAQWDTAGVSDQKARAVGRSVDRSMGFRSAYISAFFFFFSRRSGGVTPSLTEDFSHVCFLEDDREGTRTEGKSHERGKVCRGRWSLRMTFFFFSLNVIAVGATFYFYFCFYFYLYFLAGRTPFFLS